MSVAMTRWGLHVRDVALRKSFYQCIRQVLYDGGANACAKFAQAMNR